MFQFTGLMRDPGINARLTATPSLSQPSTPQLLTPRHPPYALICLTTLTQPSKRVEQECSYENGRLAMLVELLSCYSVFCQIVKDQPQPTPSQETIKKHKASDSNKLRHRDPQAAFGEGGYYRRRNRWSSKSAWIFE